ncbi:MAG: PKD domain-containing protein [Bacteroidota bacterium]|nr:PKD domain-containing protein [Bacteroidota bacterium]
MKLKVLIPFFLSILFLSIDTMGQQCAIQILRPSTDTVICLGDSVYLVAEGSCDFFMNNGFENGLGAGWSSANANPSFRDYSCTEPANEAEYRPGPGPLDRYMWIGATNSTERTIVTDTFDVTLGNCFVKFWMRYGRQANSQSGDCEDPEAPAEGVHLQYSLDDGVSWVDFDSTDKYPLGPNKHNPPFVTHTHGYGGYWTPIPYGNPYPPGHSEERYENESIFWWHQYSCQVPPPAEITNVRFRFAQLWTDEAGYDTWGLDEVMIFCSNNQNIIWSHGETVAAPPTPVVPTSDTMFWVMVSDTLGNFAVDTVFITVLPTPDVDLGADTSICWDGTNTAVFDAGPGYEGYLWNTGDTVQIIYPDTSGLFIVTVNNATCYDTDSVYLTVIPATVADAGSDESICQGDTFFFSNSAVVPSGISYDSIKWMGGLGSFVDSTQLIPIYVPTITELGDVTLNMIAYGSGPCGNDTSYMVLTLDTVPQANFTSDPIDTLCLNETVNFYGTSTTSISSWSWDFGDGNVASGQNVTYNYTAIGSYMVTLIVVNIYGCSDTVSYPREVVDLSIDFSINPTPSCVGDTVYFDGTGDLASFTDWIWHFGDGDSATGRNVYHVYTTYDTFDVTLDVCNEQVIHQHIVHQPAQSDAGSDEMVCEWLSFDFSTSATLPAAVSYDSLRWFGGTGTFDDPTVLWPVYTPGPGELGDVSFMLVAYGKLPCSNDTSFMTLHVIDSPEVYFTYTPDDSICVGEPIIFNGSASTNIISWDWNFGDGNTATGQNTTHAYSMGGSFNVSLIVVNDSACSDTTVHQLQIHILPEPDITVSPDTTICAEEELTFTGSSTTNVVNWDWDFGDGNTDNGQVVTYTYNTPGSYLVSLIVLNDHSCLDTAYQQVVIDTLPIVDFTTDPADTACINEIITFNGTGGPNIVLWTWDYGDGGSGAGQNESYAYTVPGNYIVTLIAFNIYGCVDTVQKPLVIVDVTIDFNSAPNPSCVGDTVYFTGIGIAGFTDWIWDFGDGSTDTGKYVSHVYSTYDTFDVALQVCSEQVVHQQVVHQPSESDAGSNEMVCERLSFDFTTSATLPGAVSYDSLRWVGGTGTFNDPTLLWPIYTPGSGELGDVILTLIVYGKLPCSNDTSSMILHVIDSPENDFTYLPADSLCVNEPIIFSGNSTTNIINWDWDFGDGNVANGQNVTHAYVAQGFYDVSLIVTNDSACMDTATHQVEIHELPVATISISPNDTICAAEELTFNGSSTTPIIDWDWDFGDGNVANGQNVTHTYPAPGTYTVSLIVLSENSCLDTAYHQVVIDALPTTDFTISPNDTSCVGEVVSFDGTGSADIISWDWDFGDGNIASGQNVTHTYTSAGTYSISLIVANANGCLDTAIHQRVVIDVTIDFSMTPDPSCQDYLVSFNGIGNASFTDWLWDFGDGNTAIGKNVTHTYTAANTYTVTLDVCSETVSYQLLVNPPAMANAGSDTATCEDVWFDLSTKTIPPSAANYGSILWFGGTGTFDDPTAIAPIYTPGAGELGFVTLYMVSYGLSPCANDTSTMILEVIEGAYAQAGSDENSCADVPYDFANSSFVPFATNYLTLQWSGGAGSFVDPTVQVPVYIPAPGELGPITMTMLALGVLNCDSIDDMVLYIRPDYLMPFDTTICYHDSVFAQGGWQGASGTFYDTLLSVWDCDSVIQTNLTVLPEIDRDFTITPNDSSCIGEPVFFTQTGSANLTTWFWDFGDGATSNAQDPNHQYVTPGSYTVTLTYTDDNGCSDFKEHDVFVFNHPDVDFSTSQTSACVNAEFTFRGLSNDNIIVWEWDLGDGTTALTQNVSHIYTTYGLFYVTLTVTADNGCISSITKPMVVAQPPTADFEYYVVQCDTIQFTDLSTSPPGYNLVQWQWAFGDGDSSILQNPWHVYDSSGIYLVTMIVSADSSGNICNDTITKPITVPAHPTVYFTWAPEPTCLGNPTSFFGTSGGSIAGWYWDFGDGNFSTLQEPDHTYSYADTFNVILSVTDINGCTDTVSHNVRVIDIPDVDFTISPNPTCIDHATAFMGTSSSNITSWSWNFGDGGTGFGQSTTHVYAQTGTYTVVLTVGDTAGCTNNISYPVTVNPEPTANFTHTAPACSNDLVYFTNYSSSPNGSIQEWEWDLGDGTVITIQYPQDPDIAHLYAGGGSYTVTLTVIDIDSCTNTTSQVVEIESSPIADFNNTPGCQGEAVEFTDLSSENGGSTIVLWYWEFDDPSSGSNTSTQQNPTHLFSSNGTYNVILVVHNVVGCADTLVKAVEVYELPPVDFTMDTDTVCVENEITFTSQAATASTFDWDFGDGGTSILRDPVYVYMSPGTYTVTLTVVDDNSCSNWVSHDVVVDALPWAAYTNSAPACTSTPVTFNDQSSAVTGFLAQWHWYFGDGTDTIVYYPDDPDVNHSYINAGTYIASLAVTSSGGCVDSVSQELNILQGPEAMFDHTGSDCEGSLIQFNDLSNAFGSSIGSWAWNFGDPSSGANNTSNLQNPTHTFSSQGDYTVTLEVTLTEGCYDTTMQVLTISPPPAVYYYSDPPLSCFTDVTYFYTDPDSTNIAEVASYLWDFDDPASGINGTSTLQDPTHVFTSPGTYDVSLTITDINGCENTIIRQVQVSNKPTADYTFELPCMEDSTQFFDGSIGGGTVITSWFWDFDDPATAPNDTSNLQDPRHMFSAMGTYYVMLIVRDLNGCMDTTYRTVDVSDSPHSAFRFNQACDPPGTIFYNDSSWAGTGGQPVVDWLWELEPGYFSNEVNPQYTYNYTDSCYQVNLTVTDQHGCQNTSTRTVCVSDPLSIAFTGNDVCQGERTFFSSTYHPSSDSILQWSWDFGDGTTITHTSNDTISHQYTGAGTYLVIVTAENTDNCLSEMFQEVRVEALPEPDFTATTNKCDEPTKFTDHSISTGSIITSWSWDFGDGSYSSLQNPTHTYGPEDSTYMVTLTLTNQDGCIDSITREVIKGVCVQALFEVSNTSPCNNHDACFNDYSFVYADEYPLTRWEWDFGDGYQQSYTHYQDSICHVYEQSGTYQVTLIVTALVNGVENKDTTQREIQVFSGPTAEFASAKPCINSNTAFTDLSQGNGAILTSWRWDFGDLNATGDTSTLQNPTYSYANPGEYTVELITMNNYGCADTIEREIDIFLLPEADFSYAIPCEGKVTQFTDETMAGQAPFNLWSWSFGDSLSTTDTSNLQNPGYTYSGEGYYVVELRVKDENTCEDIISRVVEVYPTPESDFDVVENYESIQGQVLCENLSSGAILYAWDFGNGQTSELVNPVVFYDENGTYIIQLISTNDYQCADTSQYEYEVILQGLYVPNAFVPEGDNPELRIFKPSGIGLKSYRIEVINRWGTVIWSSGKLDSQGSPAEGWDGTYKGSLVPVGDYTWKIWAQFETGHLWKGSDAGDGNTKTYGTVTLIR